MSMANFFRSYDNFDLEEVSMEKLTFLSVGLSLWSITPDQNGQEA